MKTAKVFLTLMYVHLLCSIVSPIAILLLSMKTNSWNMLSGLVFILYLLEILALQVVGFITVGMAISSYCKEDVGNLRKGVKLLKIGSIPFYIINFIYSTFIWFILVGASRGIMIIFVPIPMFITYLMILQSGCVGACYIKCFRNKSENSINGIHYLLQFIPILDVISSIIIIKNNKCSN